MNTLLMSIQKSIQATHNAGQPTKPAVLPLSSVQEVDCFEDIDDDTYSKVASENEIILLFTFIYIIYTYINLYSLCLGKVFRIRGGYDLKGAVKCCFKEALPDDVTSSFTWFGREGLRSLYDTRIARAIFGTKQ